MSVRKRKWITSKGEQKDAWVLDYRDRDGKRRTETFKKKKDTDERAAEVAVDIRAGVHVPRSSSITVAEAGENWISRSEENELERGTVQQYRINLDCHIRPYIGHAKLADLMTPDVNGFLKELYTAGMSVALRRKVLVSLSSILRLAVNQGHVKFNAADPCKVNTSKRSKRNLKIGKDIPSMDEIRVFLECLNGHWRPFFLTAVFTGMRASELRGLRWENVDLGTGEIHVRERADAFHKLGNPKSEAGERTIPVGPIVVNTLREWKLQCPRGDLGLVFPTRHGTVQSASNIRRRALIPLMEKAGIVDANGKAKYRGLHALRHFYASWLINPKKLGGQGLPPKEAQDRLGHSTLAMTMDTYGHLFPRGDDADQLREAELALIG